jgi:hypothetical protein
VFLKILFVKFAKTWAQLGTVALGGMTMVWDLGTMKKKNEEAAKAEREERERRAAELAQLQTQAREPQLITERLERFIDVSTSPTTGAD